MVRFPETSITGPPLGDGANPSNRRPLLPPIEAEDTKSRRSEPPSDGENGDSLVSQAVLSTATDSVSTATTRRVCDTKRPLSKTAMGEQWLVPLSMISAVWRPHISV